VKAWTVRRRATAEIWDKYAVTKLRATLEDPEMLRHEDKVSIPASDGAEEEPPTEEELEEEKNRHIKLRAEDNARYGHSDECAGCARMRRGAKPPYRYNDDCRRTMEKPTRKEHPQRWEIDCIRRAFGNIACSLLEDSSEDEGQLKK